MPPPPTPRIINNYDIVYKQLLNEKIIETSNLVVMQKRIITKMKGKSY